MDDDRALPTVAHASTKDAISLAAKYYANSLSAHLMQLVGQQDSVAVMNSYKEEALFALRQLQLADGSFSWWPGMRGSLYITVGVAETLQRLNMMIGEQQATKKLLDNSMKFMAGRNKETVLLNSRNGDQRLIETCCRLRRHAISLYMCSAKREPR